MRPGEVSLRVADEKSRVLTGCLRASEFRSLECTVVLALVSKPTARSSRFSTDSLYGIPPPDFHPHVAHVFINPPRAKKRPPCI